MESTVHTSSLLYSFFSQVYKNANLPRGPSLEVRAVGRVNMGPGSDDAETGISGATIDALDAPTLGNVLAHLSPAEILRFSTTSKQMHQAVDEPLWRELFQRSWDDPVWPVESYRELYTARHRALEFIDGLKRIHRRFETARLEDLASCCKVLAGAVNASKDLTKTEETIRVHGLRMKAVIALNIAYMSTRKNQDKREDAGFNGPSMEERPTDSDEDKGIELERKACRGATYAVSALLSALIVRSKGVRADLLLKDSRSAILLDHAVTVEHEEAEYPVIGWAWDFPTFERETSDDALAAALGGLPQTQAPAVPFAKWESVPPSIALALYLAPLALLGEPGRESRWGFPLNSHPYLSPNDPVPSDGDDRVPIVPNVPGRGPWPRGGRPPHGQRLRMERIGEPSTATSMSGAWFGARLSLNTEDEDTYSSFSVDSVFRATLTVTPEGKVSGWIKDTVGNLTLRGVVKVHSEDQEVVLDGVYTDCGGLPGVVFGSARHGQARLRLAGFASATMLAGDWTQFSGGHETRGVFCMWPNDEGKESKAGMKRTRGSLGR